MAFFSRKPVEILAEDEVRFKAVLGVRPEVYVTVLCAFLVAATLFLLLFFPGLANPGSVVAFRSEPSGAAVSVDGVYAGQTPCDVFTARGGRTITMTMAGFRGGSAALTVESRVFGSLFFPRRGAVSMTLEEEFSNAALLEGAREFADWSFTAEPTEVYQIPLVLSEGAYRSGAADEAARRGARDILAGAARFTQTKAGMKDLIRALHLSGNGGNAPSPLSLVSSIQDALSFLQDNSASAAWLAAVLPPEARETVLQSGWYAASEQDGTETARLSNIPATETVTLIVEGVTFIRSGDNLWAATTPVTAAQFARFTEANPEWREENASTLAERGLATIDYLVTVEDTRYPAPTVSGVSWYAAEAYCRWLSARLPASLSGWTAALPSEAQWDEAASTAGVEGTGTIWEWCADPYAPFPALGAKQTVIAEIGSPEKLARGANWTRPARNGPKTVSRGSVPPESSTPFVSFRPVLERRK